MSYNEDHRYTVDDISCTNLNDIDDGDDASMLRLPLTHHHITNKSGLVHHTN